MAARKSKAKARTATGSKGSVPKGFKRISGFGESWPNDKTKKGDSITGTVTEFDEFETTRKVGGKNVKVMVQNAKIETEDGQAYTVYESAGLRPLFEYEEGVEVYIEFLGMGPKTKGKNPMKLFDIFVRDDD